MGRTVYVSANGLDWTVISSPSQSGLISVAYGGGQFVALSGSGEIYTSPDAKIWSPHTVDVPDLGLMTDLAYGSGRFVATGYAGGHQGVMISSTDGVHWTNQVPPLGLDEVPQSLMSIAYGGGYFVAVEDGGPILTSPDGEHWTARNHGVPYSLASVAYANGSFFAAGIQGIVLESRNLLAAALVPRPGSLSSLLKYLRMLSCEQFSVPARSND